MQVLAIILSNKNKKGLRICDNKWVLAFLEFNQRYLANSCKIYIY